MAELSSPEWSNNVALLSKTTLDLPPSCLEFIPKLGGGGEASSHLQQFHHEYFVVGTYYLEKEDSGEVAPDVENHESGDLAIASKPQSKNGSLVLFRYHEGDLQIIQTLPCPSAVFDLHFLPESSVFAIVSSAGDVAVLQVVEIPGTDSVDASDNNLRIKTLATHQVFKDGISPTFFTWAPKSQHTMGITTSDGVYLLNFSTDYSSFQLLNGEEPIIKHSEYAWCCSFSDSGDRIFSGGDDNKLRLETLGSTLSDLDADECIEVSGLYPKGLPGHDAGVTFILPLPYPGSEDGSQILLTGSYDDRIRVYSVPAYPARPSVLKELNLGGGVWRLKFLNPPLSLEKGSDMAVEYIVLASCMHAGARILSITGTKQDVTPVEWVWAIKVLADMSLHKSMNYASDVQEVKEVGSDKQERICVSSSFYDRLLCVWKWDPDEVIAITEK